MSGDLVLSHHDAADARRLAHDVIVPIYAASHADVIDDPFYSVQRFLDRLDGYAQRDGFEMVAAHMATEPVGLAFGYTLPPTTRWWEGLVGEPPDDLTRETGHRTFALNEIMVDPAHQRQGIARALHDELMSSRPEERATLLVRPDNEPAQTAYANWGWRKVAKLKPFPDSPVYDALILPLR